MMSRLRQCIPAVLLLVVYGQYVTAITCDIKSQSYNGGTVASQVGYIDVNGVRAASFMDNGGDFAGLHLVAITPACEILDYMQFFPPATGNNQQDSMAPGPLESYYLFRYIQAWPVDTIFIGASAEDVTQLFDREVCNDNDVSRFCIHRRSLYTLAAMGLQFHYGDGDPKAAGFVVQKGHPEKAQWMLVEEMFGPLGFETQITTPDVYVCTPRQPIINFPDSLADKEYTFALQEIQCDGYINAWRFYAKTQGEVRFSVWRYDTTDYRKVSGAETIISPTRVSGGDNYYCVSPIRVHKGDYVAVWVDRDGLIPLVREPSGRFNDNPWPNCKQTSSFGLTELDLVPMYTTSGASGNVPRNVFDNYRINFNSNSRGAIAAHPFLSTEAENHCSCSKDSDCTSWDRFSFCDTNTCRCKDDFILDYSTLTCIRANVAEGHPVHVSESVTGSSASSAVDGGSGKTGTCATVNSADRPWLVVDLGMETAVHAVRILPADETTNIQQVDTGSLTYYDSSDSSACTGSSGLTSVDVPDLADLAVTSFDNSISCVSIVGERLWKFYVGANKGGDSFTLTQGNHDFSRFGSVGENEISSIYVFDQYPLRYVGTNQCVSIASNDRATLTSSACTRYWYYEDGFLRDRATDQCLRVAQLANNEPLVLGACTITFDFDENAAAGDALILNVATDYCVQNNGGNLRIVTFTPGNAGTECGQFSATFAQTRSRALLNNRESSGVIDSKKAEENDGGLHWASEEDALDDTFCHPPCITYSTRHDNNDYNARVRDVSENKVWFTIWNNKDWKDSDDVEIHYTAYEPALFNFDISVSNSLSFEPGTYTTCTHYNGNAMGGQSLLIPCDEVVFGRYIKIHMPGDGFADPGDSACQAEQWFSICDLQVQGLPARSYGFPCKVDEDCTIPFTNQYLRCESEMCVCADGFLNHATLDICIDIDECFTDDFNGARPEVNGGCEHHCVNTAGSYHCECFPGYELKADKHTCQDKNECSHESSPLPTCMALCGRPLCIDCDTWPCVNRECRPPSTSECEHMCDNSVFPYQCSCFHGYQLAEDDHRCIDVNECLALPADPCDADHGICTNYVGKYECTCKAGWRLADNNRTCVNINECLEDNGGCDHMCTDSPGDFTCSCRDGYAPLPNNLGCAAVDECNVGTAACDAEHGVCENMDGGSGFRCSCEQGWVQVTSAPQHTCVKADVCGPDNVLCEHVCLKASASSCGCFAGYRLSANGFSCLDIDECEDATKTVECEYPGLCVNTAGGFTCGCPAQLSLADDGKTCLERTGISSGAVIGLSVMGALLGLLFLGLLTCMCWYCFCRSPNPSIMRPQPQIINRPQPQMYEDNVEYITTVAEPEPMTRGSIINYPSPTYSSFYYLKPSSYY